MESITLRFFKTSIVASFFIAFVPCLVFSQAQIADSAGASESVKEEKSLFQANAQLAMSSADYQVTAGDTYALSFYSIGTSVSYTITVDSSYKIRIANLGSLNCKGLSFLQLKQNIENLVMKNYPLSVVTFVMLQPGIFKVVIKGEVSAVHEENAWALTRLSAIVAKAGLTEQSSTRNIKITNQNGKSKICDLFKARRNGDFSQDPYLRPGDTIEFFRRNRKVSIYGSVEREGTYELLADENLSDLISSYAHGTTNTANLTKIRLIRVSEKDEKIQKITYLTKSDIDKNYILNDKDSVYIYDWHEEQPFLELKGIIKNPQTGATTNDAYNAASYNIYRTKIQFFADENYSSLIYRIRDVFTVFSDLKNAYVQREDQKIAIEAQKILDEPQFISPYLVQKGDELVIPYKKMFDDNSSGLDF